MNSNHPKRGFWSRSAPYLLTLYCLALLLFFLAELRLFGLDEHLRATNQVLILFALLILPFVVINMPGFIQSLTLRVSDKEFHIQLSEMEDSFTGTFTRVARKVSTVEQSLWPLLAGEDYRSKERLTGPVKKIIIGSKQDPSHLFFTQLLAQTITASLPDVKCEIRYPNGDSLRNFADVRMHWVDIYIDFTGTCCQFFNIAHKNGQGEAKTDEQIIDELNGYGQRINLRWLQPLGCSEDYCLGISHEAAKEYGIKSLRDLKQHARKLVFVADPEFQNRKDCYLGLKSYGIEFGQVNTCDINERYLGLNNGDAQVFVSYETDPEISGGEVLRLEDPDQFFPRYKAIPLINQCTLDWVPGLEAALCRLHNVMRSEDLIRIVQGLSNSTDEGKVYFARGEAGEFVPDAKVHLST